VCYFGEVVATHSDPKYIKKDNLNPDEFDLFAYISGNYVGLKRGVVGTHGFSLG